MRKSQGKKQQRAETRQIRADLAHETLLDVLYALSEYEHFTNAQKEICADLYQAAGALNEPITKAAVRRFIAGQLTDFILG